MVPNRATHHKLDIEEAIELNHLLELDEDEDEQLVDLLFLIFKAILRKKTP